MLVDEKLLEVPGDIGTFGFARSCPLEERVQGRLIVTVDLDLGEHRKIDIELRRHELEDLGLGSRLLLTKLVAGKPEHHEIVELVVKRTQTCVLRSKTSSAGNVDDEEHPAAELVEVDLLAGDTRHLKVIDGSHARDCTGSQHDGVVSLSRRIIGIIGCPGAGKSTLAARLVAEQPDRSVVVPMDGFHFAQKELVRLGRADRKGAPDTFDVGGYVALLQRLRDESEQTVYAPSFDRRLEEPIAGAIAVEPQHATVITEGNYLLLATGGWERVRPLLDEAWFVEEDDVVRRSRLVGRHIEHGRSPDEAEAWVESVDEPNAALIRATRHLATREVRSAS